MSRLKLMACFTVAVLSAAIFWWLNRPQASSPTIFVSENTRSFPTQKKSFQTARQVEGVSPVDDENEDLLTGAITPEWETEAMDDLIRRIRQMIAVSPENAMAWAGRAEDPARRKQLLGLVLWAWGEKNPAAALSWAKSLEGDDRFSAIQSVFAGVAHQPDVALQLGRELLASEPEFAEQHGTALVGLLAKDRQYAAAVQFASEGPAEFRTNWLAGAFQTWAGDQPEEALKAFSSFTNQPGHSEILRAMADGWAGDKASVLAAYSVALPVGEDRAYALREAMLKWCLQNPAALGEWLNQQEASPDFDSGILALVTQTDTVNRPTETALQWAENISTPELRLKAVREVMRELAEQDLAGAKKYIENADWLSPDQRRELFQSIQPKIEMVSEE